jgi:poly(3-hydroxybutyrate) depolymerase
LGHYNVDWSNVIVAGVSSGADMATQLHFSYSAKIKGEAIFAGAPFFCAQDNAAISRSTNAPAPSMDLSRSRRSKRIRQRFE